MTNEKDIADPEMEQLRRLAVLRKLIRTILMKHWILLLLLFLITLSAGIVLLAWETGKSPDRFETRVNLLYFPKKASKIQSLDDKNLMQIFTRRLMFLKLSEELHLDKGKILDLIATIDVFQNKKQTNLYTIIARDNEADGAILKANTFADLCIREYISFRLEDLKKHRDVIMQRKVSVQDSLRKLQLEEAEISRKTLVTSPEDELARLQKNSSDLKAVLAETEIRLSDERAKAKAIRNLLKGVNPAIFLHIRKIREYISELEKLDGELLSARQLYTELNPRLLAMENHRAAVAENYHEFLRKHSLGPVDQETLENAEKLHREAERAAETELQYSERRAALVKALQVNQEQMERFLKVIPDFKNIEDRRRILQETFRLNEEILSEISYLQASLPNEVTQVERSSSVVGKPLFAKQNILFSLIASLLFTGLLSVLILSLEMIFGKVSGRQEISLYPELNLLGFLPERLETIGGRDAVNGALDSLYYHFQAACGSGRIIFSGCLPGGMKSPEAEERLEWNFSMSGRRLFRLRITSGPVPEENDMALVPEFSMPPDRNSGILRVENVYVLRSPELRLLQKILEKIQQEYDLVIITREESLRRNSIFLSQMAQFCDSAVLFVGAGSTHRIILRKLVNFAENNRMKIMTVVSGENNVKPLTQREFYDV